MSVAVCLAVLVDITIYAGDKFLIFVIYIR